MPDASTSPAQFDQLVQEEWAFRLQENPLFATQAGNHRYDDRLPSLTESAFQRREEVLTGFLQRLRSIDRAALETTARVNYDFFERELRIQLEELAFKTYYIPLTKMNGAPVYLAEILELMSLRTVSDYESYLRRLSAFPGMIGELIDLMRTGAARGYLPARAALAGVLEGCKIHAAAADDVEKATDNAFFKPFRTLPDSIPASDRTRLFEAGRAAVAGPLAGGFRRLAVFLETEYLPMTSPDLATVQMPDAKAYYAFCVRRFTSLDLSPDQVHETGLAEVARIRAEMEDVIRSVGFVGSLRDFSDSLRADPRFFVDTPEQLMKEVAWLMKRIEGQLPGLFKTLPRTPFGLKEIPDYLAPNSTTAYYFLPSGDGTTAGFYYVNTYDLKSRPLYEYEALSLHEAVPGHHLQLALQLEMENVPDFRKWGETTAFIEGWALYAERLGLEMGFFSDPYTNFGRLVYEMWRAARLVVDTGLHFFDWTRQQAIDYLADNTALSLLNISNEVDRYISWPGQAVAYKIGELEIRDLRRQAETTLGPRFDIRAFHEVLLRNGGIPLSVLRSNVAEWIQS